MVRGRRAYGPPLLVHPEEPTIGTGQEGLWTTSHCEPRGTNSWYGAGGPKDHLSWCTQRHQLMVYGRKAYGPPLLVHPEAPTLGTGQEGLRTTSPGAPRGTNSWYGAGGPTAQLSWCTQRHQLIVRGLWTTSPCEPRGTNSWYGAGGPMDHLSWCTQMYRILVWGRRAYRPPLLVHPEAPTLGTGQLVPLTLPGEVSSSTSWPAPTVGACGCTRRGV